MNRATQLLAASFVVFCAAAVMATSPTKRVETLGEAHGAGRTPEQARIEALNRARTEAVEKAAGVSVSALQSRIKQEGADGFVDAFSAVVMTSTHGRIVSEHVTYETIVRDNMPVYRAHLVADVALEKGITDPTFQLEIGSDPQTSVFRNGEPLQFHVTASKDCYVTLLNVLSDGQVVQLFPNDWTDQNKLTAGGTIRIPSDQALFTLRAEVLPDTERVNEVLLAIATKDRVPFRLGNERTSTPKLSSTGFEASLEMLNRWLVEVPLDRRAIAAFSYEVVR